MSRLTTMADERLIVIQDPGSSSRIKKRRDLSGRPRGVFRLAETVPPTWEGKGDEGEALKTRIKGLLAEEDQAASQSNTPEKGSRMVQEMAPQAGSSRPRTPPPPPPLPTNEELPTSDPAFQAGPSTTRRQSQPQSQTQYKVIPPLSPRTRLMLPPKVYSHKECAQILTVI